MRNDWMKIHKKTLPNGLRVLVAPRTDLKSVSIVVGVGFGSMDVERKREGLAHYLEHMLFKGTKRRNWSEINSVTRKYNIYYNAETDYETTLYEAQVYRRYVRNAMELISEMITSPRFDKEEFRHELGPIMHEIAIRKEDPNSIVYDNMPRALFIERGRIMPETESSLKKNIGMKDLLNAYNTYYNPSNIVVAIYGGISAAAGLKLAKRYFSGFNRKIAHPSRKKCLIPNRHSNNVVLKRKDINRGEVAIGFGCRCMDKAHIEEYVAMNAIASILNNRVYDQIREVHGLSYDPSVEYYAYGMFSYILASAGGPPSELDGIKSIMLEEFRKLRSGSFSKEELSTVKRGLEIKYSMDSDDSLGAAISITNMELMYGDGRVYKKLSGLVRGLSASSLTKFIKSYIMIDRSGSVALSRK